MKTFVRCETEFGSHADLLAQQQYFLPIDYQANGTVQPAERESEYWNERRIASSAVYQYQVYQLARRIAGRRQCRCVLDVGCGVGTKLSQHFGNGFTLMGVDQPDAIEHCKRFYPDHLWLPDDLDKPQLGPVDLGHEIDLIICADVIEHLSRPEVLLAHMHNLASPQTVLVLSTPERDRLLGRQAKRPSNREHLREWNLNEFGRFIESSGWRILDQRTLFPFRMLLDRFTLKYLASRVLRARPLRTCQVAVCLRVEL